MLTAAAVFEGAVSCCSRGAVAGAAPALAAAIAKTAAAKTVFMLLLLRDLNARRSAPFLDLAGMGLREMSPKGASAERAA